MILFFLWASLWWILKKISLQFTIGLEHWSLEIFETHTILVHLLRGLQANRKRARTRLNLERSWIQTAYLGPYELRSEPEKKQNTCFLLNDLNCKSVYNLKVYFFPYSSLNNVIYSNLLFCGMAMWTTFTEEKVICN